MASRKGLCRDASFSQRAEHPALPRFSLSLQLSEAKPTQPCCCCPEQPHSTVRNSISPLRGWKAAIPTAKKCSSRAISIPDQAVLALCECFPACSQVKGPFASLVFGAAKQKSQGQKLHGHRAGASSLILVVEGSCWAQSTARASPSSPRTPFLLLSPHQAASSSKGAVVRQRPALPWCLPGEPSDVQTLPAQSSIQTWIRGSHSCSGFLTAVTFAEGFLQCFREGESWRLSELPRGLSSRPALQILREQHTARCSQQTLKIKETNG